MAVAIETAGAGPQRGHGRWDRRRWCAVAGCYDGATFGTVSDSIVVGIAVNETLRERIAVRGECRLCVVVSGANTVIEHIVRAQGIP